MAPGNTNSPSEDSGRGSGTSSAVHTGRAAGDQQTRSARLAVTAFPVLVVLGGLLGVAASDTLVAMSPAIPWALGVVMFLMGLTLTMPDFARIAKRPWAVLIGVALQFTIMPLAGLAIVRLLGLGPCWPSASSS